MVCDVVDLNIPAGAKQSVRGRWQAHTGDRLPGRVLGEVVIAVDHTESRRWRWWLCDRDVLKRETHVIDPDGQGQAATGLARTQGTRLIEAHPHDGDLARRVSTEPCIVGLVGGAGLAADVRALQLAAGSRTRARSRYAAQHIVHDIRCP